MQFLSKVGRCHETQKEEHCTTEKLRKDTLRCTCMRFVHIAMPSEALFFLLDSHSSSSAWESTHFVTHIIIHYPFLSLTKKTLEDENTFHRHWESKITQRTSRLLEDLISSWCVILLPCFTVDWQKKWRDGLAHISPIFCKEDVRIPWPERRHYYFFFLFKHSVKHKRNNRKIIAFSVAILKYLFGR